LRKKSWHQSIRNIAFLKIVAIAGSALILLLAFQNCTNSLVKFNPLNSGNSDKARYSMGGNGNSYDGKIKTYERRIPDYSCEGKPAPYAILSIGSGDTTISINSPEKCGSEIIYAQENDLATTKNTSEVVGWQEMLFDMVNESNQHNTESGLLESWCHSEENDQPIDAIVRYDLQTKASSFELLISRPGVVNRIKEPISREILFSPAKKVIKYSSPHLNLQIDAQQMAEAHAGQFKATLVTKGYMGEADLNRSVYCRLGGGLDGKSFRLRITGTSAYSNPVQNRVFTEKTTSWRVNGTCDVLLGNVTLFGDGITNSVTLPCEQENGGTFTADIPFADFSLPDGSKSLVVSQWPAAIDSTLVYRTSSLNPPQFISTAAELQSMKTISAILYILTKDIDLAAEVSPVNNFQAIGGWANEFRGVFEGDRRTILNLNSTSAAGLFNAIGNAHSLPDEPGIHNLKMQNVTINSTYWTAGAFTGSLFHSALLNCSVYNFSIQSPNQWTGGLTGWAQSSRIVSSSAIKGQVGSATNNLAGGLVGQLGASTISKSSAESVQVIGYNSVGGLVGGIVNSPGFYTGISDSFSDATVKGIDFVGGLVGSDENTIYIKNSYFNGHVESGVGSANSGVLFGGFKPIDTTPLSMEFQNTFYESKVDCVNCSNAFGVVFNANNTQNQVQILNWDFITPIWTFNTNNGMPKIYFLKR
jgi:hypothetical protein